MNELVSINLTSIDWDDKGNMLTWNDGSDDWSYSYDSLNRLVSVVKNGASSAAYTYDTHGRRVHTWDSLDESSYYAYCTLNIIDEINNGIHEKQYILV